MTIEQLRHAVNDAQAAKDATQAERPQLPPEYVAANPELFRSLDSFNWFVRHNKDELVKAGALIQPTGRLLVIPARFTATVIAIGARRAAGA